MPTTAAEIRALLQKARLILNSLHGEDHLVRDPQISSAVSTLTLSFQGFGKNLNMVNVFVLAGQSTCAAPFHHGV